MVVAFRAYRIRSFKSMLGTYQYINGVYGMHNSSSILQKPIPQKLEEFVCLVLDMRHSTVYSLVNKHSELENHHVQWEIPL